MENVDPFKKFNTTKDTNFNSLKNTQPSDPKTISNPSSQINSTDKSDIHKDQKDQKQYKKELQKINLKYSKGQFNCGLCYRRGVLLDVLGHTNQAIQMYEKSIDLSSQSNLIAYNNLANLFIRNGQFQKAQALLTVVLIKVVETNYHLKNLTLLPMIHVNRGICYLKMNNYEKCELQIRQIKKLLKKRQLRVVEQENKNLLSQKNLKYIKNIYFSTQPLLNCLQNIRKICLKENNEQIKYKEFFIKKQILSLIIKSFTRKHVEEKQIKKIKKKIKQFEQQIDKQKTKQTQPIIFTKKNNKKLQCKIKQLEQQNQKLKIFINEKLEKSIKNAQNYKIMIQKLSQTNPYIRKYILQVYWLLVSYFIAFKVAKTDIFITNSKKKNQYIRFIQKICLLFNSFTQMHLINNFNQVINKLCSLYLDEQVNIIDYKMFCLISNIFCNQLQISQSIAQIMSNKIPQICSYISKREYSTISQNMILNQKAIEWMKKKKVKIIEKTANLNYKQVDQQKIQAFQDVSFIISKILESDGTLKNIFDRCYDSNFRKQLIIHKYTKDKDKKLQKQTKDNSSCACTIFTIQIQQNKKNIVDQFIQKEEINIKKYYNQDTVLSFFMKTNNYKAAINFAKTMDLTYLYRSI